MPLMQKNDDFQSKIAHYQRQAIDAALLELGCGFTSDNSPRSSLSSATSNNVPVATPKYFVGSAEQIDNRVYQVQFKYNFRYCTNNNNLLLNTGDFVVLDCTHDQEDLGVVSNHYSLQQFEANRAKYGKSADEEENKISQIVRVASLGEREHLPVKHDQEQRLLKICQHLATNVFRLPMNIYGVEFQFDGKKVNIFYTSDTRVDYKALVKEIYIYCKIHIWMRKTNRCVKFSPKEFATTALISGSPPFVTNNSTPNTANSSGN